MEQRRLRLGDILDDYCPRERRLTNHAVVAMIEEDVKQTRCTTCDAEHVYKGGKVPRRRKKDTPAALYKEVLAGMPEADAPVLAPGHVPEPVAGSSEEPEDDDVPVLVPLAARPIPMPAPEPARPVSQSRAPEPAASTDTVDGSDNDNDVPEIGRAHV